MRPLPSSRFFAELLPTDHYSPNLLRDEPSWALSGKPAPTKRRNEAKQRHTDRPFIGAPQRSIAGIKRLAGNTLTLAFDLKPDDF